MVRSFRLALVAVLLALAACTNRPLVQVCDPCGCKCVAAPLLVGCGEIPRGDEKSLGEAPAKAEPASELPPYEPSADEKVLDILVKKRVKGLHWEETNLDQAVAYLRTITGLSFYVTPKVREEKFEDIVYAFEFDDVSLKALLDLLTEPFGLRWEPRDGVIWILTSEEIDGPIRVRYFDVKDLCKPIRDFVGTPLDETGAKPATPKPGDPQRATIANCEELLDDLRDEVHSSYWDEEGATLYARNGILLVRASWAVQDSVEHWLEARRATAAPISAEMQKQLDKTQINFAMDKGSMSDAIKTLQIQTGLNLMIDPRVEADIAQNVIVGMKLKDAPLETAMNMLAAAAGEDMLWISKGRVLVLTRKEYLLD